MPGVSVVTRWRLHYHADRGGRGDPEGLAGGGLSRPRELRQRYVKLLPRVRVRLRVRRQLHRLLLDVHEARRLRVQWRGAAVIPGMIPGTAREQFQRVERMLANVEELGRKMDAEINGDVHPYQDAVLAFFVACWSLRDWSLKDPRGFAKGKELNALIDASPDLATCADICNGIKHTFPAAKHKRSKSHAAVGHTFRTTVEEGPPGPDRALKQTRDWIINIGLQKGLAHGASMEENLKVAPESQVEARVLARRCVATWRTILQKLNL